METPRGMRSWRAFDVLIDTQSLVWWAAAPERLSRRAAAALLDPDSDLMVSTVTAFEFSDLHARGRFGGMPKLAVLLDRFAARIVALPADAWRLAETLPQIHKDPVDRMLVAHALIAEIPLLSSDEHIARYPLEVIW